MTESLLVVRELDKNFGGVQAVKGLSLEIAAGEIVGLIGPNGSGKSTSVNLISGTMRATRGQMLLGGHDISTATIGERVALGLARTFQTTSLFPEFSLLEQVLLGAHTRFQTKAAQAIFRTKPYRQEDAAQRERAADLLEFMGLLGVAHAPASAISSAQQRLRQPLQRSRGFCCWMSQLRGWLPKNALSCRRSSCESVTEAWLF